MKKNKIFFLFSCLFMCLSLIFMSGCKDSPEALAEDDYEYDYGTVGKKFSELSEEDKSKIRKLYGTYWMDRKDSFVSANDSGISVCSAFMSISYENILWHKKSDGNLICSAYHKDVTDYSPEHKRVILLFRKTANGGTEIMQNITAMKKSKSGPFTEKKEPVLKSGKNDKGEDIKYYLYADDGKSPKIAFPSPL